MTDPDEILAFALRGGLLSRLEALHPVARGAFAAACAQRLLLIDPPSTEVALTRLAVSTAWRILRDPEAAGADEVLVQLDALDEDDLDEDAVAGAYYALKAATSGSSQEAAWAAGRAFDAAFEAAKEPPSMSYRPLADDARDPHVQNEYRAQLQTLEVLELSGATHQVLDQLKD
jgi:hypothetical protein